MDFVQCDECSEYILADAGACHACNAVLPADVWAERRGLRRRLECGNYADDLIVHVSKVLKLKKIRNLGFLCAHLFLAALTTYLFMQPLLLPMPLAVTSFFLLPAGLLACGMQATSVASFFVPKRELRLIHSFDYLVLGSGLMISAVFGWYLDQASPTVETWMNQVVLAFPFVLLLFYRLCLRRPSVIISREGIRITGHEVLIPYADVVFAYPVSVGVVTQQSNPNSWDVRIKFAPQALGRLTTASVRGDTLIIPTLKYGYLASVVLEKLKEYNCPLRATITETWTGQSLR